MKFYDNKHTRTTCAKVEVAKNDKKLSPTLIANKISEKRGGERGILGIL